MTWQFELFDMIWIVDWIQVLILTTAFFIALILGYVVGYDAGKKDTNDSWYEYYRTGKVNLIDPTLPEEYDD